MADVGAPVERVLEHGELIWRVGAERILAELASQMSFARAGAIAEAARAGLELAWVPVPAIYDGAESSFRPVRDTARSLAHLTRITA